MAYVSVYAAATDKLNFSVGLSLENSNNIFLAPDTKTSETIVHELFTAGYQRESAGLNVDFSLNVDHQNYRNHTFPDRTVVSSLLNLTGNLIKSRLFWDVQDRLETVQTNISLPNLPTNTQDTNYFSTGPRFVFIQNDKNSLFAGIKYQRMYLEITPSDYSGYVINTSYLRNVTRTFSLGFTANYNNKQFDNKILNTDYARTDVTLNLKKRMKLSNAELDIGKTFIYPKLYSGNNPNIVRASYTHQLGFKSSLRLNYKRQLSDFGSSFSSTSTQTSQLPGVGNQIFLLEMVDAEFKRSFGLSTLTYTYSYFNNDYQNNILDTRIRKSTLSFDKKISASSNVNVTASYQNIDSPSLTRTDVVKFYSFKLIKNVSNAYRLAFHVQYINRDSVVYKYDERRIGLGGYYYFR